MGATPFGVESRECSHSQGSSPTRNPGLWGGIPLDFNFRLWVTTRRERRARIVYFFPGRCLWRGAFFEAAFAVLFAEPFGLGGSAVADFVERLAGRGAVFS